MPGARAGAKIFLPLWLVAAGVNMWVGVSQAGYSVADSSLDSWPFSACRRRSRALHGGGCPNRHADVIDRQPE